MNHFALHALFMRLSPVGRLLVWLAASLGAQTLAGAALASAFLLLPLAGGAVLRRFFRLFWRTRWLLLSLLAVFALGDLAGDWPLPDVAGALAGALAGLTQVGRLLLVLAALALFLETTPLAEILAALRAVLAPLARCGVDVDRAVVRLALTLLYAERPNAFNWRQIFGAAGADRAWLPASGDESACIVLPPATLRGSDCWALAAVLAILAGLALTAA